MEYIRARRLSNDILMGLNELYKRVHSDEELVTAINHVVTYVNLTLVRLDSPYVCKEIPVKARKYGVELPDDYINFKGWLSDEELTESEQTNKKWHIRGTKIYTDTDDTMIYYRHIPIIHHLDEIIELPYFFYLLLVRLCIGYINGSISDDDIATAVASETNNQSNNLEISRELPFYL